MEQNPWPYSELEQLRAKLKKVKAPTRRSMTTIPPEPPDKASRAEERLLLLKIANEAHHLIEDYPPTTQFRTRSKGLVEALAAWEARTEPYQASLLEGDTP